ncbi:MAG: ATP-binding protein [Xanthobacteraceae bacterium]
MGDTEFHLACLRDPRLAAHAASAHPAWLWSVDGARSLWANANGAALLGAQNPAELTGRTRGEGDAIRVQIARLGASLPRSEKPRLERLRGFGIGPGRLLTCACSRITLADRTAVLIVGTERAGPDLSLREHTQRGPTAVKPPVAVSSASGAVVPGQVTGKVIDSVPIKTEGSRAEGFSSAAPAAKPPARPSERRHPLRFVWQMDGDGNFSISSEEFTRLVGPKTAAVLGKSWDVIAAELALDPDGHVAQAAASQDTWSGITVAWPIDGSTERLGIELSGLPVFDRQRTFRGYRGFGVCRDLTRLANLAQQREATPDVPRDAAPATMQASATPTDVAPAEASEAPATPREGSVAEGRPILTIVPPARNVVPFRAAGSDARSPVLGPVERTAFRELAQQLSARLGATSEDERTLPVAEGEERPGRAVEAIPPDRPARDVPAQMTETVIDKGLPGPQAQVAGPAPVAGRREDEPADQAPTATEMRTVLDEVPAGVLIYRLSDLIYANRAFLDWAGHQDIDALAAAGGLDSLLVEPSRGRREADGGGKVLALTSGRSDQVPVEARLQTVSWDGDSALMLSIAAPLADDRRPGSDNTLRDAQTKILELKILELEAILDITTDAIVVLDGAGSILGSNASARALFGHDRQEMLRRSFTDLLAPESHRAAHDSLDALTRNEGPDIAEPAREMIGRGPGGGMIPLLMSMRRVGEAPQKLCAVFRDNRPWKKAEEERLNAQRQAERASSAKANVLAKISHEVRTPLNAIIGFCEVMIEERFGPIGNDRYREYLKDIHTSGGHLISLINDLLDLSKIESGKLELSVTPIVVNELTQQCVAIMQSRANRERIIIRTSLSTKLPPVLADARSVRQIVLHLLANSIEFTNAGGQVIVSTALADTGDVVLRVRDTGVGMNEQDLATALEPFRQLATSPRGGGTGLGLPLAKALAEANGARFSIASVVDAGTLVEVAFPPAQALTE